MSLGEGLEFCWTFLSKRSWSAGWVARDPVSAEVSLGVCVSLLRVGGASCLSGNSVGGGGVGGRLIRDASGLSGSVEMLTAASSVQLSEAAVASALVASSFVLLMSSASASPVGSVALQKTFFE